MPDDFDHRHDIDLGAALRALPTLTPPHSAWPRLHARLPAPRHRPHPGWFALAAALALALLLPRWLAPTAPVAPSAPTASHSDIDAALLPWMAESSQLEALVALSRDGQVESATAASLGVAIQDRIERIDALLARADLDPGARLPLWQERVLRLRELAGLENTRQLLAANGDAEEGVPVLAF